MTMTEPKSSVSLPAGAYTALVTPFTEDGASVDTARLREHVKRQAEGGVAGVVPCGTTGESPTLSTPEHRTVVETTIDEARALGLTVIAGAGSNDTAHAVELHRLAADAGAHGSLQVTPYYNKPSQEGLYRHFMTIADSADLPIVLYNIPGRCVIPMELDTIQRMAQHPNIVAIKDAAGSLSLTTAIIESTNLMLLSGDDPLTLPMGAVGGRGVISVVSNLVPGTVARLCAEMLAGQFDQARATHYELLPVARALLTLDSNPVPLKAAMAQLGLDSGAVRGPLAPASPDVESAIHTLIEEHAMLRALRAHGVTT